MLEVWRAVETYTYDVSLLDTMGSNSGVRDVVELSGDDEDEVDTKEADDQSRVNPPKKTFACMQPTAGPASVTRPEAATVDANEALRRQIASEIERYKSETQTVFGSQCPLQWWRSHSYKFPKLAQAARRVLAVPATSAPCERLFSQASLTVSDKRTNLSRDCVQSLVLVKCWHQYLERMEIAGVRPFSSK
jgi:hypothetical protein